MSIVEAVRGLYRRGLVEAGRGGDIGVDSTNPPPSSSPASSAYARMQTLLDREDRLLDEADEDAHPSMYVSSAEWAVWWEDLPLSSSPEEHSQRR
jgi:hypothetical protein